MHKTAVKADIPFESPNLEAAFASFPESERDALLTLRQLILDTAKTIGPIEESLKWGQPAYRTPKGSTLRLGLPKSGGYAIYAHCQTTIISDFRSLFPDDFRYDGNRGVLFATGETPGQEKLRLLIRSALTYQQRP
ncbi:DUF1801 domain-containing protein [Pontivivens ytuae]|uniref:DUF1801 domain-containing protein n=1 Tax=Pontivivens ytuae TaxID=2789856 RepID=A0A7S9LVJ5_9RHOB|nr:DUF1801 domain-containing protein [Pontivivens ytuae]QPH55894.1 DUF1801 domain-containing protein [Pontivivens ytuae]